MDGEHHDHGAKDNKRRAQEQPQEHIDSVLHLVDIRAHTGDEGGSANGIQLRKAEGLDMGKQIPPQTGGRPDGSLSGKKLGGKATRKAQNCHEKHQGKIRPNDPLISRGNAVVNDPGHQQRHRQIKGRFQHLKGRRQDALELIFFHIGA